MEYKITFEDGSEAYLAHHGVKGMKWGVWNEETRARYSNAVYPNGIMPKGTRLSRISRESPSKTYKHDPLSGDIKYVSTNYADTDKWLSYFLNAEVSGGLKVNKSILYETVSDIKVAKAAEVGKLYVDQVLSSNKHTKKEAESFYKETAGRKGGPLENVSLKDALDENKVGKDTSESMKMILGSKAIKEVDSENSQSGKKLVEALSKKGYGAVQDALGWNVSTDPLIVLNPKQNLKPIERLDRIKTDKGFDWKRTKY